MRTNEALNKAIWKVLVTKFKKDAKEAFEMVQDNGYEVCKNGCGTWTVTNPQTKKFIYLSYRNSYRIKSILYYGNYTSQSVQIGYKEENTIAAEFDFVNCLATPINKVWEEMRRKANISKSLEAYNKLESAKWRRDYEEKQIEWLQAEIAKLQKELVRHAGFKVEAEQKVTEVRRELGLIR